jgi:hypothetical protein
MTTSPVRVLTMPRKKITLEEAFAVFEQHGLQVEVKAVQQDQPVAQLSDFLEDVSIPQVQLPIQVSKKLIKITLYARHSIANGGQLVKQPDGTTHVINNGVESYGPGVIIVPADIAQQLLHQDGLARQADEHLLDRKLRSYVIVPRETQYGTINCGYRVSEDSSFDMSGFLGQLGNNNIYVMR